MVKMCCVCVQATMIHIHPLYVMLPCTISASLAFMLPVATPPNAIAFSYGHLKVLDMVWLNISQELFVFYIDTLNNRIDDIVIHNPNLIPGVLKA